MPWTLIVADSATLRRLRWGSDMGLADIVRDGVALAHSITNATGGLQASVSHEAWTGDDTYGQPTYSAAVARPALIDWQQKQVRTLTGEQAVSRARIDFLYDVVVDEKDRLTLPDGTTGPILDMAGFVDPITGRGYTTSVFLG